MIKFFRKIRQQLLTENRFSKYLIYAIGEIILVVIGILIALSINNWSEDKKALKKEITIYNEFISELNETKIELEMDLGGMERNLRFSLQARNIIMNKDQNLDSLKKSLRELYNQKHFRLKTSAFESLKSIGLNNLSNDTLRKRITNLYQLDFEHFVTSNAQLEHNKFPDTYLPLLKKHLIIDNAKITNDMNEGMMGERRFYFPYQIKDLNKLYEDDSLLVTIQESLSWRYARIRQTKGLIEKIIAVTHLIEDELKRLEAK